MACPEHCLLCFEALEAYLEDRRHLSLDHIQSSWASYSAANAASGALAKDPLASRRVAATKDLDGPPSLLSPSPATSSLTSSAASPALVSTPATSTSLPLVPSSTPLFVTWNRLAADGDTSLRGCIGTFEARPLTSGLPKFAVDAAVQDPRFAPITKAELPKLQVGVTLLTNFEEAANCHDWEVGTHGIRLSFRDRGRRYDATYLPDVASEQGWSKDEVLFNLVRKSGWDGSRARWKALDLKVTRYQGIKCGMDYQQYKAWKDWMAAGNK